MTPVEKCSHGVLYTAVCKACSIVWHRSRLECALEDVERHKAALAALEQEDK